MNFRILTLVLLQSLFSICSYAEDWSQYQRFYSTPLRGVGLGTSVSISGDYAVAGAPGDGYGAITIYKHNALSNSWEEFQRINAPEGGNYFGVSVSISGNYIAVGVPGYDYDINLDNMIESSGAVFVYKRDESSDLWSEYQRIIPEVREFRGTFGYSVCIDGSHIVALYPLKHSVHFFTQNSTTGFWDKQQVIQGPEYNTRFGSSICIKGNIAAIGDDWDAGKTYILEKEPNSDLWLVNSLFYSGGTSVSISQNRVVSGLLQYSSNLIEQLGVANVYCKNESGFWALQQQLFASDPIKEGRFGESVSIDDDEIVVTSALSGAYHFKWNTALGVWEEKQKIIPYDGHLANGTTISISNDHIMIGDYNGSNPTNPNAMEHYAAGIVYFYKRVPELSILSANNSSTVSILNANLKRTGGDAISNYGVCWNTTGSPTLSDSKIEFNNVLNAGNFSMEVANLEPNTMYYYRGFATNSYGTNFSNVFTSSTDKITTVYNGSDWSPAYPSSLYNVVIDGDYSGDGFTCNNFTLNAGKHATFNNGDLIVGGNFLQKSDDVHGPSSFIMYWSRPRVSGNTTVEQYFSGSGGASPNGRYWYFSSPFKDASSTAFDLALTKQSLNALWSFSEPNYGYSRITAEQPITFAPGIGYAALLGENKTISFSGTTLFDEDINIPLTRAIDNGMGTNPKRGYNLIGNPYPSYVNIKSAFRHPNTKGVESSIWYRSYNSNSHSMIFDTYNAYSGEQLSLGSDNAALTDFLAPMQAFWVRATTDGSDNRLAFTWEMRSNEPTTVKLRNSESSKLQKIRLQVSNGNVSDMTLIGFYPEALDGIDNYDSHKLFNDNATIPEIYTCVGQEKVAINGLPPLLNYKELLLGFKTQKAGAFSINATEILNFDDNQSVMLLDMQTNCIQNLRDNPNYSFTSGITNSTDRFKLIVGDAGTNLNSKKRNGFYAYGNSDKQIVFTLNDLNTTLDISVYSTLGQEICKSKVVGSTILDRTFEPGIYLVKAIINGKCESHKVYIK